MTEQEAIHFPSLRDGPKDQTRKSRDSQMCKLHIVVRCFASPRNDRTRLLRRGARHRARFRATRWPPCANASRLSQAMTAGTSPPKKQKAGSRPAALLKYFSPLGARAERGSTRALKLLLLRLLGLLRLLRLLRFLSHSILIWVNGWKRDTRHARRRANLATSSTVIPTDSQAAAPHCHACVITLSTDVMRFDVILASRSARGFRIHAAGNEPSHRPRRPARVNDAPTR